MQISSISDVQKCSYKIKTVVIQNNEYNAEGDVEFNVAQCINVEEIIIGNYCGKYVTSFTIAHLPKLKMVVIGENSFTQFEHGENSFTQFEHGENSFTQFEPMDDLLKYEISRIVDENRTFHIFNCTQLKSIVIDVRSFSDYYIFKLESMTSYILLNQFFLLL